jgi:tubulin polyglutamylase TTLL6/13
MVEAKVSEERKIMVNTKECYYDIVKRVAKRIFGWRIKKCDLASPEWDIYWTDNVFSPEMLSKMKPYQKINHFPGTYLIARKNNLAKYLKLMQKQFPDDYSFFPLTWVTPYELFDLKNVNSQRKTPLTLIVKPDASSQGKGIFITRKVGDIPKD